MIVEAGDRVRIDYNGSLTDGTLFESTKEKGAAEFVVGGGTVIRGLEKAVVGMKIGDFKSVTIPPEEAYGPVMQEMIVHDIPRSEIHKNITPQKGMMLQWDLPDGKKLSVKIIDVKDDTVSFDGNHLLAGEHLVFDITLLELIKNN